MDKFFFSWTFIFISAHFLLLLVFWAVNLKYLWLELKNIKPHVWIVLFLIFLFGFYLRNAEYWRGPFSDGYMFEDSAQMWMATGKPNRMCMLGNSDHCHLSSYATFLPGYPYLIVLSHIFFGSSSLNVSIISAVLSSLTIVISFLIGCLLFKNNQAGLFASLVFALIPLNIIQSQTGLSRPTGLFFVGLCLVFYLLALRNNRLITWLLAAVSLSYAIYVRQETYVLLPVLMLFVFIFKFSEIKDFFKHHKTKINSKAFYGPIIILTIFFVLQLPALRWLLFANPFDVHSVNGCIWGFHYRGIIITAKALAMQLFNHSPLWPNGIFHYNLALSLIFIFSFLVILFSFKKKNYFILGVYLVYFIIYSLVFDGGHLGTNHLTHDYVRRSLMLNLPYAVIAGYGMHCLYVFLKKHTIILFAAFVVCVSVLMGYLAAAAAGGGLADGGAPDVFAKYYSFYFPRSIFRDARVDKSGDVSLIPDYSHYWSAIKRIPDNCLVITYYNLLVTDSRFAKKNLGTAKIDLIQKNTADLFAEEFGKYDCIVYFEDWYCQTPAYIYWQDYHYPCWYMENKMDKEFFFRDGNINIYKVKPLGAI